MQRVSWMGLWMPRQGSNLIAIIASLLMLMLMLGSAASAMDSGYSFQGHDDPAAPLASMAEPVVTLGCQAKGEPSPEHRDHCLHALRARGTGARDEFTLRAKRSMHAFVDLPSVAASASGSSSSERAAANRPLPSRAGSPFKAVFALTRRMLN